MMKVGRYNSKLYRKEKDGKKNRVEHIKENYKNEMRDVYISCKIRAAQYDKRHLESRDQLLV